MIRNPAWPGGEAQLPIIDLVRGRLDPSGCGLLPGGDVLPGSLVRGEIRWADGAFDGVGLHHVGRGEPGADVADLVRLIGQVIARRFRPRELGELYERARTVGTLSYIDPLMAAIGASALPASGVYEVGHRLARQGRHVEPVKLGIALMGASRAELDQDLLLTLGRHDEFTLYCAVAICNADPDPEPMLWELAKGVSGWGRIQAVERLAGTSREDIQDWLVREGFRNTVMDEYLAWIAATTGRLLDRLSVPDPDDELVRAAVDITSELIAGGPAKDIDDFDGAPQLLARLVAILAQRPPRLRHFVVADCIAQFLRRDDWDERLQRGWTQEQRDALLAECEAIKSWAAWPAMAAAALEADDDQEFWAAERTAKAVGIDTFAAHWRRLRADPIHGNWFAVMRQADEHRIGQVLDLAMAALPLASMATGPSLSLGMSPEFAADNALAFILQDLGRFPGHGWPLIEVGLRDPVVRVRNMAVNALGRWPRAEWPPEAAGALRAAARIEPNDRARDHMNEVLSSHQD